MSGGPSTANLLAAYAKAASRVLPREMRGDRCLNATRVTIEALRPFAPVTALSVEAMACNTAALAGKSREEGAYAVATDTIGPPTENRWCGHLVAIVGNAWLVDAAAGQMARPEHGIYVDEVLVLPITKRFLRGKDSAKFQSSGGVTLRYEARLGDYSYRTISGFQPHAHNMACARVIRVMVRDMIARKEEART